LGALVSLRAIVDEIIVVVAGAFDNTRAARKMVWRCDIESVAGFLRRLSSIISTARLS
jgi:hypothetical protein